MFFTWLMEGSASLNYLKLMQVFVLDRWKMWRYGGKVALFHKLTEHECSKT
jgi:hypothetical protein